VVISFVSIFQYKLAPNASFEIVPTLLTLDEINDCHINDRIRFHLEEVQRKKHLDGYQLISISHTRLS